MIVNKSPSGRPALITGRITSFDAASCGAAAVTLQSVPVPEAEPGDLVIVRPTTHIANLGWLPGSCTVAGTALIPVVNPTAAPIDPAAAAYGYQISRLQAD